MANNNRLNSSIEFFLRTIEGYKQKAIESLANGDQQTFARNINNIEQRLTSLERLPDIFNDDNPPHTYDINWLKDFITNTRENISQLQIQLHESSLDEPVSLDQLEVASDSSSHDTIRDFAGAGYIQFPSDLDSTLSPYEEDRLSLSRFEDFPDDSSSVSPSVARSEDFPQSYQSTLSESDISYQHDVEKPETSAVSPEVVSLFNEFEMLVIRAKDGLSLANRSLELGLDENVTLFMNEATLEIKSCEQIAQKLFQDYQISNQDILIYHLDSLTKDLGALKTAYVIQQQNRQPSEEASSSFSSLPSEANLHLYGAGYDDTDSDIASDTDSVFVFDAESGEERPTPMEPFFSEGLSPIIPEHIRLNTPQPPSRVDNPQQAHQSFAHQGRVAPKNPVLSEQKPKSVNQTTVQSTQQQQTARPISPLRQIKSLTTEQKSRIQARQAAAEQKWLKKGGNQNHENPSPPHKPGRPNSRR